jgi:8-oxo-dGTP pyrophosphatase MutT (NUDIX family)
MPPVPDSRLASVLVLFYPLDGEWAVPLTLRPRSLALHAGQISLPGGRVDDGETFEQAALREFQEELGVTIDAAELLGRLSPIYVYNSNHYAVPCVAAVRQRPVFRPNAAEVARVLEVPVREMLNPGRRGWHWIRRGPLRYRAPHIGWQGARIWGATRIILGELIALLEER